MSQPVTPAGFVKSLLKWTSIWSAGLLFAMTVKSVQRGESISLVGLAILGVLVWILCLIVVAIWKIQKVAFAVGTKIGTGIVENRQRAAREEGDKAVKAALKNLPR